MSARQLRRTFAAPFVITLAGALPMIAACGPKPLPKHHNPPGPHTNPPAPEAGSGSGSSSGDHDHHDHDHDHGSGAPAIGPTATIPSVSTQPKHTNPPPPQAVPAKEPAKYEQKWTVMKIKGNAECQAMIDVNCPKGEPGKPMPTCNPPPPMKYACPTGFNDGDTLKIVLRAGATECFVDFGPSRCPDNAKCNPPPPRKVACPQR